MIIFFFNYRIIGTSILGRTSSNYNSVIIFSSKSIKKYIVDKCKQKVKESKSYNLKIRQDRSGIKSISCGKQRYCIILKGMS